MAAPARDDTRLADIAAAERDHVAALLAEHVTACRRPRCPDCRSLKAHVARTEAQVGLLAAEDAEAVALF